MYTYIMSILNSFNDAIAQLSDQVMAPTARFNRINRIMPLLPEQHEFVETMSFVLQYCVDARNFL